MITRPHVIYPIADFLAVPIQCSQPPLLSLISGLSHMPFLLPATCTPSHTHPEFSGPGSDASSCGKSFLTTQAGSVTLRMGFAIPAPTTLGCHHLGSGLSPPWTGSPKNAGSRVSWSLLYSQHSLVRGQAQSRYSGSIY